MKYALMTEPEIASLIGVADSTLRKHRWRGDPLLPYLKIGRAVRYDPKAVESALLKMRIDPAGEGESDGR